MKQKIGQVSLPTQLLNKLALLCLLVSVTLLNQVCVAAVEIDLPAGALVIEESLLSRDRALVLWMIKPSKNPRDSSESDLYTCPDETRGSYYSGPTRVSLVDLSKHKIINTLQIKSFDSGDSDFFDLPYMIRAGSYYFVPKIESGKEGRPEIMHLIDFNHDGHANEFVLYDAQACMGLETALIGYSQKRDQVIQYPLELESTDAEKTSKSTFLWVDYLYSKKPDVHRVWKFEIDYRGRGGSLDQYEVRYNDKLERFEGKLRYLAAE